MLIIMYQTFTEQLAVTFTMNPMRRTNLHSNVEVFMLLTFCTNFQVFVHMAVFADEVNCLANIFLKSLTNIFCLFPFFFA